MQASACRRATASATTSSTANCAAAADSSCSPPRSRRCSGGSRSTWRRHRRPRPSWTARGSSLGSSTLHCSPSMTWGAPGDWPSPRLSPSVCPRTNGSATTDRCLTRLPSASPRTSPARSRRSNARGRPALPTSPRFSSATRRHDCPACWRHSNRSTTRSTPPQSWLTCSRASSAIARAPLSPRREQPLAPIRPREWRLPLARRWSRVGPGAGPGSAWGSRSCSSSPVPPSRWA